MRGNRSLNSKPEVALRSALHHAGLRFRKHQRPVRDFRCVADVVFPKERIAVFLDGCYWHGCAEHGTRPRTNSEYWLAKIQGNVDRDRRHDRALSEAGWLVVRVWEHEDPERAAERIAALVLERRGG